MNRGGNLPFIWPGSISSQMYLAMGPIYTHMHRIHFYRNCGPSYGLQKFWYFQIFEFLQKKVIFSIYFATPYS